MTADARREDDAPAPVRDLDWDAKSARRFADRTVDLWEEWLQRLRELPVATRATERQVRVAVAIPVPEDPMPEEELFAYLRDLSFNWSVYPGHPRFMAYISGAGTVPGAAADLLAAGLNMNLGGWRLSPSATEVERHLTQWLAGQFGLPETAGGLLVSGGAMATFVAIKVARDQHAGVAVREKGVHSLDRPLTLYASEEVHVVTDRAADMLGLGSDAVRKIAVDDEYRIRVNQLRAAIEADRKAGNAPFAVVASAGTVATGAIDPLAQVADVCSEEGLWMHVDAAYGGPAILADDLRPLFAGIGRAHSIAFDPHKWLYTPHSGGCVLVRDLQQMAGSFAVEPTYVHEDRERTGRGINLMEMGPQFSRGFWALKVWVSLLAHGRRAFAARISHDAALARYLGRRIEDRPDFELSAPVVLSICCFRYVPADLPEPSGREEYLDELNRRLMTEIQLDGRVYYSNAVLHGRFVLRVCIVNFRTEAEDLDALLDVTAEIGARLDRELRPARPGAAG
jgi:aromatic-L-amino-acid/L-tryptophan decarboxylase